MVVTVRRESASTIPMIPKKKRDLLPVLSMSHIARKIDGTLGKYTMTVARRDAAFLASLSDIQLIDSKGFLNISDTPTESNIEGV